MSPSPYPAVPPSEVEWEDLLVRYELGPRALRAALDDVLDGDGEAGERIAGLLAKLVANELHVAALFAAMRDSRSVDGLPGIETRGGRSADGQPRTEMAPADPRTAFGRYTELRGRNFAAVQRRGIEVWAWRAESVGGDTADGETVSAHQLILASTALDGETLAGVRRAPREAAPC